MEPWMFILPLIALGFVPLFVRIQASKRLRRRLEGDWSGIADRWGLARGTLYWNDTLNFHGVHAGRTTHLFAHRALLGKDVRFWPTWFVVTVELKPPARLSPTKSAGYLVSVSDGMQTYIRPGFSQALGLLPGKSADELVPGVRFDGDPPKLTEPIVAILNRWFVPGHGFVGDEGISFAWRPGSKLDPDQVEQALKDATELANWLSPSSH